jgi:MoxR-like ATPase
MPSCLTLQTEREIRYEQRCQRKKFEQQTIDRTVRFQNREKYREENSIDRSEISTEVRSVISALAQQNRFAPRHYRRTSPRTVLTPLKI